MGEQERSLRTATTRIGAIPMTGNDRKQTLPLEPGDVELMDDGQLLAWAAFYVASCWTEEGVLLWWGRPRRELDGRTPADALLDGEVRAVYDLAEGGMRQVST